MVNSLSRVKSTHPQYLCVLKEGPVEPVGGSDRHESDKDVVGTPSTVSEAYGGSRDVGGETWRGAPRKRGSRESTANTATGKLEV